MLGTRTCGQHPWVHAPEPFLSYMVGWPSSTRAPSRPQEGTLRPSEPSTASNATGRRWARPRKMHLTSSHDHDLFVRRLRSSGTDLLLPHAGQTACRLRPIRWSELPLHIRPHGTPRATGLVLNWSKPAVFRNSWFHGIVTAGR